MKEHQYYCKVADYNGRKEKRMTKLNLGLLKKARKNRNLTTQEVGSILHRDKNTIWRWETKGDFSIKTLCKLLDLYEITPMDVFVRIRTQEDKYGNI